MGCCNSTPSPSSPYEPPRTTTTTGGHHDAPREAITSSTRHLNPAHSSTRHLNPNTTTRPTTTRPNIPIRAPSPLPKSPKNVSNLPPPWTRSHLETQRRIFFETRVTGTPEVWGAVDMVCQMIRRGDLEEAQGILDAVGLSCPHGRVARGRGRERGRRGGLFDERGVLYEVPEWVVADPGDLVEDGDADGAGGVGVEKEVDEEDEDDDEEEEQGDGEGDKETITTRPKGKGRAEDIGEEVKLRARLSDRGSDVEVTLGAKQPVRIAIQRIREQTGCNTVRLVYMGKPMDEGKTLADCGWRTGQVVNAFVFEGDESVIKAKMKKGKR